MLDFLPVEIIKYILNLYLDYENIVPILSKIINFTFDITPHIKEETIGDLDKNFIKRKYLDGIIKYEEKCDYDEEKNYTDLIIRNYKNGICNVVYLNGVIVYDSNFVDDKVFNDEKNNDELFDEELNFKEELDLSEHEENEGDEENEFES